MASALPAALPEPITPQALPPLTVTPSPTAEAVLPESIPPAEDFAPTPDNVAMLPETRPEPERPRRAEQPRERPRERRAEPRREQQRETLPRRETAAQPQRQVPASAASASRAASAPRIDPGRWQSQVQARVARSLRALRSRGFEGRVAVRFTVAPSGAISGARIARSSGNGAIDQAAVAAVARVSVPPPPPGVGRTLTVPVTFN